MINFFDYLFYSVYLFEMRLQGGNSPSSEGRASSIVGFSWLLNLFSICFICDFLKVFEIDLKTKETVYLLFLIVIISQLISFIVFSEKRGKKIIQKFQTQVIHSNLKKLAAFYWLFTFGFFITTAYFIFTH